MRLILFCVVISLLTACASRGPVAPPRSQATSIAPVGPNLGGLKLGDSEDVLKHLTLRLKDSSDAPAGPAKAYKYATADGNELSITFKDGKAVWIENDWLNQPDDDESLVKGMIFDKTTVADIDVLMGSNGYTHKSTMGHKLGDHFAWFNCYGLSDQPGTSVVFITVFSSSTLPDDMRHYGSQTFRLRSIVLASDDYLDALWGKETLKDTVYHPVAWSVVDRQPGDAAVDALKHVTDLLPSTVTTQEDRFSIALPVGFHREHMAHDSPDLYLYTDAADSRRMISLDLDGPDSRKRDAGAYLTDVMAAFSMMHTQFQHDGFTKATVSGVDFTCSSWSGIKDQKLFGGRTCVAQKGDGHIMYSELDFKHRYDDDATIYQQVFSSLKFQ